MREGDGGRRREGGREGGREGDGEDHYTYERTDYSTHSQSGRHQRDGRRGSRKTYLEQRGGEQVTMETHILGYHSVNKTGEGEGEGKKEGEGERRERERGKGRGGERGREGRGGEGGGGREGGREGKGKL